MKHPHQIYLYLITPVINDTILYDTVRCAYADEEAALSTARNQTEN